MQKHFKWAVDDAIAHKQTTICGLYKVKYHTTEQGYNLEFYDTDFYMGKAIIKPEQHFVDVTLTMIAKQWQIDIISSLII
jgi:5-hydroxyisourate hydrolase-like protein (transthyretin family)